jgi:hypothetical protein
MPGEVGEEEIRMHLFADVTAQLLLFFMLAPSPVSNLAC